MARLLRSLLAALALLLPLAARAQPAASAKDQLYTYFDHGDDVTWKPSSRRLALLIGNREYQKIGDDSAHPDDHPLRDLPNACTDVKAVAAGLAGIGWRKGEIAVLCNQTASDVTTALSHLADATPADPADAKLIVVYLAGHGMQVNGKDYFFGINARPNFDKEAKTAVFTPGRPLFANQAIPVQDQFTLLLGPHANTPVLLILDACRDNPMYLEVEAAANRAYDAAFKAFEDRRKTDPRVAAPPVPHTGAPGGASVPPRGMLITFASSDGATVADNNGSGKSYLAGALVDRLAKDTSVNATISLVIDDVAALTQNFPANARQTPDTRGRLLADAATKTDWCFYGCQRPGMAARDRPHSVRLASLDGRPDDRRAEATLSDVSQAPVRLAQGSAALLVPELTNKMQGALRSQSIYTDKVRSGKRPYALEVFWCSDDSANSARRVESAWKFANEVAKKARLGEASTVDARFERIILTHLSKQENALPINQYNDDAIFTERGDSIAAALAAETLFSIQGRVKSISEEWLHTHDRRANSAGRLEAYFCRGAYPTPRATKVFVQVPSYKALSYGTKLVDQLSSTQETLNVIQTVEVVPTSPEATQVRYFAEGLEPQARAVATSLQEITGRPVEVRYLPQYKQAETINQIEVWVGTNVEAQPALPSVLQQQTLKRAPRGL